MRNLRYSDFVVELSKTPTGFMAGFTSPVAGEFSSTFVLPFQPMELENLQLKMGLSARTVRGGLDSPAVQAAKEFGGKLYEALFTGDARAALKSTLDQVIETPDGGVRIQIRFRDTPELASIPWEFLYQSSNDRFLALSDTTPVVRYVEVSEPVRVVHVQGPLSILAMVSSPSDYPPLNVEREKQKLMDAVRTSAKGNLLASGAVKIQWLENATLAALQLALRRGDYHIFHFIGHGGVKDGTGVLVLETEQRRGHLASGADIGTILFDARSLGLAVLNSCEGARAEGADLFSSTAANLIRQGLPAVVAMQFEISDDAAIVFAREFYSALADGMQVDSAVVEARKMMSSMNLGVEWATPVLFTRMKSNQIFEFDLHAAPAFAQAPPPLTPTTADKPVPSPSTRGAEDGHRPPAWIWLLLGGVLVSFIGLWLGVVRPFPGAQAAPSPAASSSTALNPIASAPTQVAPATSVPPSALPPSATNIANTLELPAPTELPTRSQGNPLFEDSFESGLNTSKWTIDNTSSFMKVANGVLQLSSSGTRYPYVYSKLDLFPTTGNFSVKYRFRYSKVDVCGVGIVVTSYLVPASISQESWTSRETSAQQGSVVLGVWQGIKEGPYFFFGSHTAAVWRFPGPDISWHEMSVLYSQSQYKMYLDGQLAYTSVPTPLRPQFLWLGNPVDLGAGFECPWDTLEVDYIQIESLP